MNGMHSRGMQSYERKLYWYRNPQPGEDNITVKSGISQLIREMQAGAELNWLYQSDDEVATYVSQFIKDGIYRREKVLLIGSLAQNTPWKLTEGWHESLGNRPSPIQKIDFSKLNIPGAIQPDLSDKTLDETLREEANQAIADGFLGVRIVGEIYPIWQKAIHPSRVFLETRAALGRFIHDSHSTALWLFQADHLDFSEVMELLVTTPRVLVGNYIFETSAMLLPDQLVGYPSTGGAAYRSLISMFSQRSTLKFFGPKDQWFHKIFEHVDHFVGVLTPEGKLVEINRAALRYGGTRRLDVLGRELWQTPWWQSNLTARNDLKLGVERANRGEIVRYETDLLCRGNRILTFDFSIRPVTDNQGKVSLILIEGRDITSIKQAQKLLIERDHLLHVAVRAAPIALLMIDKDGVVRLSLGHSPANDWPDDMDPVGKFFGEAYAKQPEIVENIQRALEGESFTANVQVSEKMLRIYFSPFINQNGDIAGVIGVGTDITRSRITENALFESEARFKTFFEEAGIGIVLKDLEGRVIESNPAFQKMLGYTASELHLKTFNDLTYPPDLMKALEMLRSLLSGEKETHRTLKRYVRKDGQILWGQVTASMVRGLDGKPLALLVMVEDISNKIQMETELVEVQRRLMESREIERLHLAQDLHDGPLQELYGISYALRSLDEVKSADERAAGMAKVEGMLQKQIIMLRTFCGELRPPTLAPFGLEKAIQSHADHFQNMHPNIQMRLELMHDRLTIPEKVRLALYRIYQELLNNIVRHAEASIVFIRLRLSDDQISLEVEDNGRGFIVPKRWVEVARQGHLGLVGATERAESVGGTLSIQSTPGKGTVVQVFVPRSFQDDMWSMENLINESVEK